MIEIKNLTKIFKSKLKEECVAIDNITFTIPSTGFNFIIGKSGSGKTTLLSLIGSLDNITSGDIIVDGTSLKNIKEREASKYRNEKVAFIYQDYHLIDELTVEENIKLALDLINGNDIELVHKALEDVDLKGYENRYPKELSGGEKQRVAIARALVKKSSIILADEPTGNLDTNTSNQILSLLKKISEDRLVLIVSHDLYSAKNYADRIIKLSSGKIVDILKRNNDPIDKPVIKDETLYLPFGKELTEEDEENINAALPNVKKIHQVNNEFIKDDYIENNEVNNSNLKGLKLGVKKAFKIGIKFFKTKVFISLIYAFILAILINVLGLSQTLSNYPENEMIAKHMEVENLTSLVLKKENNSSIEDKGHIRLDISNEEINQFQNLDLKGHVYVSYNTSEFIAEPSPTNLGSHIPFNPILVCDKEYVNQVFNDGKDIEIIKRIIEKDSGYYITDFEADLIILNNPKLYASYDDILKKEEILILHGYKWGYVNGIIKTNYKEKYKDILKYYNNFKLSDSDFDILREDPTFIRFIDDITNFYSVKYSFNKNFIKDSASDNVYDWIFSKKTGIEYNNKKVKDIRFVRSRFVIKEILDYPLKDNEVIISSSIYKTLTGKEFSGTGFSLIDPFDVNFNYYDKSYISDKVKSTIDLKVVGVFKDSVSDNGVVPSEEYFKIFKENESYPINLYFDNLDDINIVLNKAKEKDFTIDNYISKSYKSVADLVGSFKDIFTLIKIILLVGIILLFVMFVLKSINDQMHNIGILKSLGANNMTLFSIFSVKIIFIWLITILIYLLTSYPFILLSNDILINSINEMTRLSLVNIVIIDFDINIILINVVVFFMIIFISMAVENIKLRKIKPINIIKAKE